jgi:hypothetical protein
LRCSGTTLLGRTAAAGSGSVDDDDGTLSAGAAGRGERLPPRHRSSRSGSIATSSLSANIAATACLHAWSPVPASSGQVHRIQTSRLPGTPRPGSASMVTTYGWARLPWISAVTEPWPTTMSITAWSAQ